MYRFSFMLFLLSTHCLCTHIHAGDISFKVLANYQVELNVVIYSDTSTSVDSSVVLYEGGSPFDTLLLSAVQITADSTLVKRSGSTILTYNGHGIYHVYASSSNRSADINNIPNSVAVGITLPVTIEINPWIGFNETPVFGYDAITEGMVGVPFVYNSMALDPEGDSLSYVLAECLSYEYGPIAGYTYPPASNFFRMDSVTGLIQWNSPMNPGTYNVRQIIKEFRYGYEFSSVCRDLQFKISSAVNIKEIDHNNSGITVFPNPARDEIYIRQAGSKEFVNYELINSMGSVIFSGKLDNQKILLPEFDSGMYILSLRSQDYIENIKILKK